MTDLDHIAELIDETTAARGVDLYAVEVCGLSAREWATRTGRNPSTVNRNINRANESQTRD